MTTRPDTPTDIPDDRSWTARTFGWCRTHTRATAVGAIAVVLVAGAVMASFLFGGNDSAAPPLSKNPVVAGYEKQLPALAAAVQATPSDPQALRAYGVALYATGDVSRARDEYEAELKINSSDPVLLNNLGNVYRDLGTYDEALDAYQKSISIDPASPSAYVNLANLYNYTLNQKALGISTILEAQRNMPDDPNLGVLLGIAYEQVDDPLNAQSAFQTVLVQDPSNAAAKAGIQRVAG